MKKDDEKCRKIFFVEKMKIFQIFGFPRKIHGQIFTISRLFL